MERGEQAARAAMYPALIPQGDPSGANLHGNGDGEVHYEMGDIIDPKLAAALKRHSDNKYAEGMPRIMDVQKNKQLRDGVKKHIEDDDDEKKYVDVEGDDGDDDGDDGELSEFELEVDDLDDKEEAWKESSWLGRIILSIQSGTKVIYQFFKRVTRGRFLTLLFLGLFTAYFIIAMNYEFGDEGAHRLLGLTLLALVIWAYPHLRRLVKYLFRRVYGEEKLNVDHAQKWRKVKTVIRWVMYLAMIALMVYMVVDEAKSKPSNMRSLPGIFIFLLIALLCSTRPTKVDWHTIFWSVALQFVCAVFVLKWNFGKRSIYWFQKRFSEYFKNADQGSELVFGPGFREHIMIFGGVPLFLFANATFTVLYYLGAMQFIVRVIGRFLRFFLNVSPVEAMSVSASIFMEGVTTMMMLRPFLARLSRSELFTVVAACMSSLGAGYMALLAAMGVSLEYLIPAMLISAPATFAIAKIMVPEARETDKENRLDPEEICAGEKTKYLNVMDAAQTGALSMLPVMASVVVIAYTFFSGMSWVNHTLGWLGDRVGVADVSIEMISSYVLYPIALAMGVEPDDCRRVAMLIGYRFGVYNVVAFLKLTEMRVNRGIYNNYMAATNFTGPITEHRVDITLDHWNQTLTNGFISERSEAVITYCLCGFSSALSAALLMGVIYTLVPKRKKWINSAAIPAIIAGNLANCMTGCFASLFY